jgi:hypothetical protein
VAHSERIAGIGVRDLRGRGPEEDVVVPIDRLESGVLFAVMRHVTGVREIISETFVRLVASGTLSRRAQRSADHKLPAFQARIERYRRLLQER